MVQKLVILLRFGSQDAFDKRWLKYSEIREIVNVKESTLRMIVKRFRDNDYSFPTPASVQRPRKLNDNQMRYVIS